MSSSSSESVAMNGNCLQKCSFGGRRHKSAGFLNPKTEKSHEKGIRTSHSLFFN
jgi:hypothetical protein